MEELLSLYHRKRRWTILQHLRSVLVSGLMAVYLWAAWQFGSSFFWQTSALALGSILVGIATQVGLYWRANRSISLRVVSLDLTALFFLVYSASLTAIALHLGSPWPSKLDMIPDFSLFYIVILCLSLFLVPTLYDGRLRRTLLLGAALQIIFTSWFYIYLRNRYDYLLFGMNAVLAVTWLLALARQEQEIYRTALDCPITVFILVGLLSTWGAAYVYDSLPQFLIIANEIFIGYILIMSIANRRELNLLGMMIALMRGGAFSSLFLYKFVVLWHNLGLETAFDYRYIIGSIHPDRTGPMLTTTIMLSLGLFLVQKGWRWRGVMLLFLLLQVVTLLFTYSSSGWLGFPAGLVTFGAIMLMGRGSKFIKSISKKQAVLSASVLIGLVLLGTSSFRPIIQKAQKVFVAGPLQTRLTVWSFTLGNILEHPIFGTGLGNYYVRSQYAPNIAPDFSRGLTLLSGLTLPPSSVGVYIDDVDARVVAQRTGIAHHPHNIYLLVAEGTGLVGLTAFIWVLISLTRWQLSHWSKQDFYQTAFIGGCLAGLCTLLLGGMIDAFIDNFWLLLSLAVVAGRLSNDRQPHRSIEDREQMALVSSASTNVPQRLVSLRRSGRLGALLRYMLFSPLALLSILFVLSLVILGSFLLSDWHNKEIDALVTRGKLEQAIIRLKRAQAVDPLNANLHTRMGDLYWDRGQAEAALIEYQQAASLKRDFAPLHTQMGRLHLCEGQLNLAIPEFKTAIELDPWGVWEREHYSDLGLAYALAGEREQSIQVFQQAFSLEPAAVIQSYWQTDPKSGAMVLRLADSNYCPSERSAFYNQDEAGQPYLDINEILGRMDEEVHDLDPAIAEKSLIYLGECYLKLTRYDDALPIFEALKGQRNNGIYDFKLGMIYADVADLAQAEESFDRAVQFIDEHPVLHYEMGELYARQARYEEAESELKKAIALFPHTGYQDAYLKLIDVYLAQGQTDKAISALRKEVFFRDSPDTRRRLAGMLKSTGAYEEAIQEYRQILLSTVKRDTKEATDWRLSLPMQRIAEIYKIQGLSRQRSIASGKALLGRYRHTFSGHIAMGNFYLAVGDWDHQ
jgi:tetratricopeptide (TPR) repeat protein/O-antigen ligase